MYGTAMGAQVNWGELSLVLGAIIGAGSIVAGFLIFLWTKFNAQDKALADHRLETAKTYVTAEALMKVEERLNLAIDRLGDKLERALERGFKAHS